MKLEIKESAPDVSYVALEGSLNAAGVYAIETAFKEYVESRKKPTIVDMSGVTDIASVGMRMLLASLKVLRENGARMVLLKPQRFVDDALRTACLDQVFFIVYDEKIAFLRVMEK